MVIIFNYGNYLFLASTIFFHDICDVQFSIYENFAESRLDIVEIVHENSFWYKFPQKKLS